MTKIFTAIPVFHPDDYISLNSTLFSIWGMLSINLLGLVKDIHVLYVNPESANHDCSRRQIL